MNADEIYVKLVDDLKPVKNERMAVNYYNNPGDFHSRICGLLQISAFRQAHCAARPCCGLNLFYGYKKRRCIYG